MKPLSDNFLRFLEPAFEVFGNPMPRTLEHDAACAVGHVTWNAVVMEAINPGSDYLTPAKEHRGTVPAISEIIDMLAKRKREMFADDNRLIGFYDIKKKKDGSFYMWTEIIEPRMVA